MMTHAGTHAPRSSATTSANMAASSQARSVVVVVVVVVHASVAHASTLVAGHAVPPFAGATATSNDRRRVGLALLLLLLLLPHAAGSVHVPEHSPHCPHAPVQSMGQALVLQAPSSSGGDGHETPPNAASELVVNTRSRRGNNEGDDDVSLLLLLLAFAHVAEQAPHCSHAPTQSTGHTLVLHACDSVVGHGSPPTGSWVTPKVLERVPLPPHDSLQAPHWTHAPRQGMVVVVVVVVVVLLLEVDVVVVTLQRSPHTTHNDRRSFTSTLT
jgi:hypothetical protein